MEKKPRGKGSRKRKRKKLKKEDMKGIGEREARERRESGERVGGGGAQHIFVKSNKQALFVSHKSVLYTEGYAYPPPLSILTSLP